MKIKAIIAMILISGSAMAQTNAVFSDGNFLYSLGGTTNLTRFSRATEYTVLTWSSSDLANLAVDMFGTEYKDDSTGVSISSGSPDTFTAYNSHVVFTVTAVTTTGTVTVSGQRVLEDENALTNWTENINIATTGYYQTSAKFSGTCTNSTTNANITTDVSLASYYDLQNQDFKVSNVRMSWKPSNPSWDVGLEIFILDNDGLTNGLLNGSFDFDNGDTIPRAAKGVLGHAKQNIDSRLILGSENEGIIVKITGAGDATPSNIKAFDLTIGLEIE